LILIGLVLPRSFRDSWKFSSMCHLAEADTANAKFLVDRMYATTTLASCVTTNLELRFAASFNL